MGWCYANFTARSRAVLERLKAEGRTPEIAGAVWHQGWNDGCSEEQVKEYEQNLGNLIRDIRLSNRALRTPWNQRARSHRSDAPLAR